MTAHIVCLVRGVPRPGPIERGRPLVRPEADAVTAILSHRHARKGIWPDPQSSCPAEESVPVPLVLKGCALPDWRSTGAVTA